MKESEIRRFEVLNKYLQLVEKDVKNFLKAEDFVVVKCPACNSENYSQEFQKMCFSYVLCDECDTLFANPRPSLQKLNDFYSNSKSTHFWINEFFKPFAESRREKIFKPRVNYICNKLSDKKEGVIGDVGAGFGIFLEELAKCWPNAEFVAIEPSLEQAEICREKGLNVQCCALENIKGFENRFNLLTAFELLEHLFDPQVFLSRINCLLKPGAYFLMTTLNIEGFDIQVLWQNSKSISPPHHINFFNPDSIKLLLEKCGFEVIEFTAAGELDWDIVEGRIKNENINPGRLWDLLAFKKGSDCKKSLQQWIKTNNLSSHMRIIARKK